MFLCLYLHGNIDTCSVVHVPWWGWVKSSPSLINFADSVCLINLMFVIENNLWGNVVETIIMVRPLDLANHIVSTTFPHYFFQDAHVKLVQKTESAKLTTGGSSLWWVYFDPLPLHHWSFKLIRFTLVAKSLLCQRLLNKYLRSKNRSNCVVIPFTKYQMNGVKFSLFDSTSSVFCHSVPRKNENTIISEN